MNENYHAVIDYGSNTINLAVYDTGGNKLLTVYEAKEYLGVLTYINNGILSEEGMEKSLQILSCMKSTAATMAPNLHCFATASLRNVSNAGDFIAKVKEQTDLTLEVISAKEEAYYDYLGVVYAMPFKDMLAVDVGGGSAQFLQIKDLALVNSGSILAGSLKLHKEFVSGLFPQPGEIERIEDYLEENIRLLEWFEGLRCEVLCTIGGTAKAIAKLNKKLRPAYGSPEPYEYDADDLRELISYALLPQNQESIKKLLKKRACTLVPGIIIFYTAAKKTGAKKVVLSKYGVREGYMYKNVLKREAI